MYNEYSNKSYIIVKLSLNKQIKLKLNWVIIFFNSSPTTTYTLNHPHPQGKVVK